MLTALLLWLGVWDLTCLILAGIFDVTLTVILASCFAISEPSE